MIYNHDAEIALKKLKKIDKDGDEEQNHIEADKILCKFLKSLGYSDIVREYVKIPKWYA
jgi:hypothetical protein